MDETNRIKQTDDTELDQAPSSAFNRRRTAPSETGAVFSRSRIGGKEIRIPASAPQAPAQPQNETGAGYRSGMQPYNSVYPAQNMPAQNKRATISTNRVFSPYDLSFFEDPVTTRELSNSERKKINDRRYSDDSQTPSQKAGLSSETNAYSQIVSGTSASYDPAAAFSSASPSRRRSHASVNNTIPDDEKVVAQHTAPAKPAYVPELTPETNVFPEDNQNTKPVFTAPPSRRADSSAVQNGSSRRARRAAASNTDSTNNPSGSTSSPAPVFSVKPSGTKNKNILTPANNVFPENDDVRIDFGSPASAPAETSASRRREPAQTSPVYTEPAIEKTLVIPTPAGSAPADTGSDALEHTIAYSLNPGVSFTEKPKPEPAPKKETNDFDSTLLSMFGLENSDMDTKAGEKAAQEAIKRTNAMKTQPETPAVVYAPAETKKPERTSKSASSASDTFFGSFIDVSSDHEDDLGKTTAVLTGALNEPVFTATGTAPVSVPETDGATRMVDLEAIAEEEKTAVRPAVKKKPRQKPKTKTGTGGGGNGTVPPTKGSSSIFGSGKAIRIITILLVIGVVLELIAGAVGLSIVGRMTKNSPNLNLTDFVGEESTKIYDDSGELITEVGVYLRENITYDKCPESLVDAFLSIEDSRFFSHFGFDIPRFTKALIDNIKTHSFGQGGSTFTMQLVKNTYFSIESMDASNTGTERTRSIEYKVQQIDLAMKLEKLLSKKEIFQLYLNKLNFGGNIRGVQRASQYYFGKNTNELTLHESAMLAGIVNLPNRYNPYEYLDYGTERRNTVLNLMCNHGYITEEQRDLAKKIKVEDTLVGDIRQATEDSQYQSYLDVVLEEAMELTGLDPTVKGMQIYTHLNRAMQEQVEAIQNGETQVVYPDDLIQVAMVAMDNRNGAIVAVGGGRNYDGARLLNRATMGYKQPGSSVKPLLSYGLAFEYLGYSLDEVLLDKPITYPMESMVLVNASGNYAGDVMIKDAVGNSLNIPAILTLERVVNKIGAEKVVEYLQTIGFSHVKAENFHLSYAIGGTTFETTCKELAGAHSMLINKGVYNKPHTIEKIVMTTDGSEFYPDGQNIRALSSGSAYLATELEANNVTGPYFNYMQLLARSYPVYAKTGTTDWGNDGVQYGIPKGQMKDKWMVASTSQYTNCVWVGYDMAVAGKETYYTSYKSSLNIPGNINRLLLDKEEELFGVPEAIPMPEDVTNSTYIYGTFPHVRPEYSMDGGGTVTSLVSNTGLENMPQVDPTEFLEYAKSESEYLGTGGMSANYNQFGILKVSWANSSGICAGGQRNIGLHDAYNNIDQWGACLADLSWLVGDGAYWGTVYVDDVPVAEISSTNGFYSGYVTDQVGEVKVCGGSATADGSDNTACTIAQYMFDENANGYVDENGNWIPIEIPEYEQYGYWDENGNWVGQGHWDENGFHLE